MKHINIKKLMQNEAAQKVIIFIACVIFLYLLISLYFTNHFYVNTMINGVNVSLKSYREAEKLMKNYVDDFQLRLIERNGETEIITGKEIGLQYNQMNSISQVYQLQNSLKWLNSFLQNQKYYVKDLYSYQGALLKQRMDVLNCLNREIIEPKNVQFRYSNGSYEVEEAVYGNKINRDKLEEMIDRHLLNGVAVLDLDKKQCYENPKYTINSEKTAATRDLLNRYAATKITFHFGDKMEFLDGSIIKNWISVDDNLEVLLSAEAVADYVKTLSEIYDTVGITRNFKTSMGKIVEVKGGLYGWRIDRDAEAKELIEYVKRGAVIEKEPIYIQKALSRDESEIGDTYVEINITRQYLWFYKKGKLIAQGSVVTGNPNRGNSTVLGTNMINYKQNNATLSGPGYGVKVTYWMPFYGNIGIHDASWRHSFGGQIYRVNGTHGCVNAPFGLAKKVFENIDKGIPVISYEEK